MTLVNHITGHFHVVKNIPFSVMFFKTIILMAILISMFLIHLIFSRATKSDGYFLNIYKHVSHVDNFQIIVFISCYSHNISMFDYYIYFY